MDPTSALFGMAVFALHWLYKKARAPRKPSGLSWLLPVISSIIAAAQKTYSTALK
jgi:hypothetical protein